MYLSTDIFILLFSLTIPSCLSWIIYTQDVDTNIWYFNVLILFLWKADRYPRTIFDKTVILASKTPVQRMHYAYLRFIYIYENILKTSIRCTFFTMLSLKCKCDESTFWRMSYGCWNVLNTFKICCHINVHRWLLWTRNILIDKMIQ